MLEWKKVNYITKESGKLNWVYQVPWIHKIFYSYGKNQHIIVESKDRGVETLVTVLYYSILLIIFLYIYNSAIISSISHSEVSCFNIIIIYNYRIVDHCKASSRPC